MHCEHGLFFYNCTPRLSYKILHGSTENDSSLLLPFRPPLLARCQKLIHVEKYVYRKPRMRRLVLVSISLHGAQWRMQWANAKENRNTRCVFRKKIDTQKVCAIGESNGMKEVLSFMFCMVTAAVPIDWSNG